MENLPIILHLRREQIDSQKWDTIIAQSMVGTIYNYSYVLDALFPKWSALIIGNYDYIFPITLSKKLGITYFYPPLFHSYFSVFSTKNVSDKIQAAFLIELKHYCLFYEFPFLPVTTTQFPKEILVKPKVGQLLHLRDNETQLKQNFNKQLTRNLKKSHHLELKFEINNHLLQEVVQTFQLNVGHKLKELTPSSYEALALFMQTTIAAGKGSIYACYSDDQLLAIGFFTFSNQRIIYHKGGNTSEGKKISAMSALLQHVILSHSNSATSFDFGGSSIPSIKRYNDSFGAEQHTFYTLIRTPFLIHCIKFLKKLISFKNRLAKTK